jgi:DNA-binding IclR family transcriptional regulator
MGGYKSRMRAGSTERTGRRRGSRDRADVYRTQVLDRTLRILDVLAESSTEMGPSELAGRLRLHKSTIHRLLIALQHHGLIRRNPTRGKYSLGMKLFELGTRAVAHLNMRECAEPYLLRLTDETRETAHVCVLSGTEMVSVANAEGSWTLRTPSTVGRRTSVHCTSVGKALAAFLPEPALEDLIARLRFTRHTRHTLATMSAFRAELQKVRAQGFAVDDEEIEEGLRCVGAPVRDYTGEVVAAISIAGPVFRVKKENIPHLARAVMGAARDLSKDLGYQSRPRSNRHVKRSRS